MRSSKFGKSSASGFGLIEAIIGLAIMGIISYAFVELLAHQNKEVQAMADRLAAQDVKRELQMAFDSPDFCGCLFRGRTFNENRPNSSRNNISPLINAIPQGYRDPIPAWPRNCRRNSNGFLVPRAGRRLAGSSLTVDSIRLTDVSRRTGPVYAGDLTVSLRKQKNERLVKPIKVPITLTLDTSSGTRRSRPILNCGVDIPTPTDDSYVAYYSGATVSTGRVLDTGRVRCRRSMVSIRFGAKHITDNQRENRGLLILRVNGIDRTDRQGGGRVSGGDITNPATSIHGAYVMPCSGSVRAITRWTRVSKTPSVQGGYIELQFFDP